MFLGEYEYKVDNKGRLPLPPKFRQEFVNGLVLTRGQEACIFGHRTADFENNANTLAPERIIESEQQRKLKRAIFASAERLVPDSQGRIALPVNLRNYAKIKDTAIIVGVGDRIELWNPESWTPAKLEAEEQAPQIIENLVSQQ